MKTLLLFAVPPAVGAVIGFVTNVVALRMLFRPLRELRVFGIRIPFTPGVLPRQRKKLADSIGSMVERELLTAELLRERLKQEDLRGGLSRAVSEAVDSFLSRPLAGFFQTSVSGDFIASLFADFINSGVFEGLVEIVFDSLGVDSGKSLNEILGAERTRRLEQEIEGFVERELRDNRELICRQAGAAAAAAYPGAAAGFVRFLRQKEIHRELETRGRIFLAGAILKLNVFQRFFISAAQYGKTLHERMPEIIDDLIGQLEELFAEEAARRRILGFADSLVLRSLSGEKIRPARVVSLLLASKAGRPLREFLPAFSRENLRNLLADIIGRTGENGFYEGFKKKLLEKYGPEKIGTLLLIDEKKKESLVGQICSSLLRIFGSEAERILGTLNIRVMVSRRIDSLDMLQVERIILDVMANQLKWIDIFGA
ncbi:MAG: DUF445 family protein, partial [Treponema sp.]|nr:DUF445 family protein [Treponema sp.]